MTKHRTHTNTDEKITSQRSSNDNNTARKSPSPAILSQLIFKHQL